MSATHTTISFHCTYCGGLFKWSAFLDPHETVRVTVTRYDGICASHQVRIVDRAHSVSAA